MLIVEFKQRILARATSWSRKQAMKQNEKFREINGSLAPNASSEPEVISFEVWLDKHVRDRVKAALTEQVTDPSIVNQLAANAVEKVMHWVKPWQTIAKIVLSSLTAIFIVGAAWLGYFGIRTHSNVEQAIQSKVAEAVDSERLKSQKLVKEFEKQLHDYRARMVSLETEFDSKIKKLNVDLRGVRTDMDLLRQKVLIGDAPQVSSDVRERVQKFLEDFKEYLGRLGFRSTTESIRVEIDPKFDSTPHFDPSRNTIFCGPKSIQDNDMVARHYVHSLLKQYWILAELESGLADYLVCSFGDDPKFGEVYIKLITPHGEPPDCIRNLKNSRLFSDLPEESGPQDAGEVWGGAFWEIRELLGKSKADQLIARTILSLTPNVGGPEEENGFVRTLAGEAKRVLDETESQRILSVFRNRGRAEAESAKP